MNSIYILLAVILPLLSLFFFLTFKSRNIIRATGMFLLVFISFMSAFTFDNLQEENVAQAVQTVKQWINPAEKKQEAILENENEASAKVIPIKDSVLLEVPNLWQMPELPRGCEVTSLAMLLQAGGVETDKLTLAKEVRKNPAEYKFSNGKIYFGDPNEGFVGNMYTYTKPGLGVYHKPIADLAEQYLPGKIKDMTGSDFEELKIHLSDGRPVWIITNTQYKKIDESFFQTWYTPTGKVKVTTKEHSVLITGYDKDFVYFNDPLTGKKNKKAPMQEFEQAWVQMGRQAITFLPY